MIRYHNNISRPVHDRDNPICPHDPSAKNLVVATPRIDSSATDMQSDGDYKEDPTYQRVELVLLERVIEVLQQ